MLDNPGKVVTKFQFSDLLRQAWYKAINPEVITAGFHKVGVCPFNRTAIKCMGSGDNETLDNEQGDEGNLSDDNPSNHEEGRFNDCLGDLDLEEDLGQSFDQYSQFTPLEEELFKTRYENGYDLFIDPIYVSWLAVNHPEALPEDLQQSPNLSDNEMETDAPLLSGDPVTPSLEQVNVNETDLPTTDSTSTEITHNGATPGDAFKGTNPESPGCVTKAMIPSTTTVTPAETATAIATTSCKGNSLPNSLVKTMSPTSSALNLTTPPGATVKLTSPSSAVTTTIINHTNPAMTGHKSKTLPSSSINATSTSSVVKPPSSVVKPTSPSTPTATPSTVKATKRTSTILKSTTPPGSAIK